MTDTLTPSEIKWALNNPYILGMLMDAEDCAYCESECMWDEVFGELGPWPTQRYLYFKNKAREIMQDDLELYSEHLLYQMGFRK